MHNSCSFMPIHLKLCKCFGHGLKMCMWFEYNPQIIFVTFPQVELSNFSGHVCFQSEKIVGSLCANSYSFMPIVLKLYRCFGLGLKMCMWF